MLGRRRPDALSRTQCMDEVDAQLAARGGPFFLGAAFSLVDITYTPFLERMAASLLYYKARLPSPALRTPASALVTRIGVAAAARLPKP